VAKPKTSKPDQVPVARLPASGWADLTWDALDRWAGAGAVSRGRTYQRGGRVKDLKVTAEGDLLATVDGTERYATTVTLGPKRKASSLESTCTCPVGYACKHAVAVVAEYLEALAEDRDVPVAAEDDPRWAKLDGEDDGEWDGDDDDDWDDDKEDSYPVRKPVARKTAARQQAGTADWDAKIEGHLRSKTQGDLADLVWSLVRRFPEVYQEFRERIALQEGDVDQLVGEARREIKKVTSEPAWRNHWSDEGHIPDYSPIRHRLERLLDLGHADEVVSLGRDMIKRGIQQVGESHDEGETATALAACLGVVFQAVPRSSLSVPQRLLFAIDAELADGYDIINDESAPVFDAKIDPEDWSAVADALIKRLKPSNGREALGDANFSRNYERDQLTNWVAMALGNAGREGELRTLYESEARATGSYERVVKYLLEKERFDDAESWAREGIDATSATLPGIAASLAASLCELAQKRKQWDVVAAHSAVKFFSDHPSPSTFDDLVKAAKKAGFEEPVRDAALRFLETGTLPYRVASPPATPASVKGRRAAPKTSVAPEPTLTDRLVIDKSWPLPVPDYLIPLLKGNGRYGREPGPRLDVLLELAIIARRPDEVLRWFDKMRAGDKRTPYSSTSPAYADQVAGAVASAYPDRAIEIYKAGLNAQLPNAQPSAYGSAGEYLKKLRPIYESLSRGGEWLSLVASIRENYRNRPRFMEVLDGLEGQTIIASSRARRK
jgi:uncharacterized Zn finger protein